MVLVVLDDTVCIILRCALSQKLSREGSLATDDVQRVSRNKLCFNRYQLGQIIALGGLWGDKTGLMTNNGELKIVTNK